MAHYLRYRLGRGGAVAGRGVDVRHPQAHGGHWAANEMALIEAQDELVNPSASFIAPNRCEDACASRTFAGCAPTMLR